MERIQDGEVSTMATIELGTVIQLLDGGRWVWGWMKLVRQKEWWSSIGRAKALVARRYATNSLSRVWDMRLEA